MNPYTRFGLVSNSITAALLLAALVAAGGQMVSALASFGDTPIAQGLSIAGGVTVLVVFWLSMTEVVFPTLFRLHWVRKIVLGKYYIEGTWLQAERGSGVERMAVIDIQPDGKSFTFSGYAVNEHLIAESNLLIEFSQIKWPFMTFKYCNFLSDGSDGQRDGIGEIRFEMNQESSRGYHGYIQNVQDPERIRCEGTKLIRPKDVKGLRTLEGREELFSQYWSLFFHREGRQKSAGIGPNFVGTAAAKAAPVAKARKVVAAPVAAPASTPAPQVTDQADLEAAAAIEDKLSNLTSQLEAMSRRIADAPAEEAPAPKRETAKKKSSFANTLIPDEPEQEEEVAEEAEKSLEVRAKEERRTGYRERPDDLEEQVIPRRRASDWVEERDGKNELLDLEPEDVKAEVNGPKPNAAKPKQQRRADDRHRI